MVRKAKKDKNFNGYVDFSSFRPTIFAFPYAPIQTAFDRLFSPIARNNEACVPSLIVSKLNPGSLRGASADCFFLV
ncbi:MAG: hypothetical protein IJU03_12295 [Thermoguttaceae bacterium]|nr:hypothetical protein [Thermoguttaceae bacterium]